MGINRSDIIGIICALPRELGDLYHQPPANARIVAGGIGASAATRAATALPCDVLVSAGYAGGLASPAARCVIVVDSQSGVFEHALPQSARGRIADSQTMVRTPTERAALAAKTGAIAVDMESAAIARVAGQRGLPFLAIRVVTDGPEDSIAIDWDRFRNDDGTVRTSAAVLSALTSRQAIAELFGLWYSSKESTRVLSAYLRRFLEKL